MSPLLRFAAIVFFLLTSFFAASVGRWVFNSPDETANAFFIRQYVRTGSFRVAEPLNVVAEDLVHPRAVQIVQHDLAPGSFLGMLLLYGWIAKIVGLWIVPFLTPIFATIASLFFYKLVRILFDDRIARWSFFLLLIHPAWIYYTARSLFPNVLFLSLLIIGLYYLLHASTSLYPIRYTLYAGLLIGSALAVRTSEAGWVLGGLLLLWYFYRRQVTWRQICIVASGIVIAFLPIFYHNTQLYGHPFYNGYSQIDSDAVPAVFAWHFQSRLLTTIFSLLLPFGIKPLILLGNVYRYLLWFFWWFAIPTVFGFVLVARRNPHQLPLNVRGRERGFFLFLCFFVFLFLWLILYYGSWVFHDTTLVGPTLGTSFTRYWLPIFVFGIPFVAVALTALQRQSARLFIFGCMIFFTASLLFTRTGESFAGMRATLSHGRIVKKAMLDRTEPSAVILTERSDKLFFPDRRVIFNDPLDMQKIDRVLPKLLPRAPVYFFTELEPHAIDFMNERRLAQHGVRWMGGEEIGGQRLYQLKQVQSLK